MNAGKMSAGHAVEGMMGSGILAEGRGTGGLAGLVKALLIVKEAAARANADVGLLSAEKAEAIAKSCWDLSEELRAGGRLLQLARAPGALLNIGVSEAVADRAAMFCPGVGLEHVMLGQADADVMATARTLAVHSSITPLLDAMNGFAEALEAKGNEFRAVVKVSRSGLRDGLPVSLGGELQGFADGFRELGARLAEEQARWDECPLGLGEAGTGLGVTEAFRQAARLHLSEIGGVALRAPACAVSALGGGFRLALAHAHLESAALLLWRLARNLCVMCSGPRGGIREIAFPAVAPGSSIMPGKVNPTVAELAMLVADKVIANQRALVSGVHSGALDAGMPSAVPLRMMLDSTELLARTLRVFESKVIEGLAAFPERGLNEALDSLALSHVLDGFCDEKQRNHVEALAADRGISCKEAALELGVLPKSVLEELFRLENLVSPKPVDALLQKHKAFRRTLL